MDIKRILKEMISRGASDLHLKVASPPVFRINGTLVFGDYEAPTVQDMAAVCQQILAPAQREVFESTKEIDFAFGVPGVARFRANFYVQRGSVAMVFRHVPVEIHSPDDLHLPPVVKELAMKPARPDAGDRHRRQRQVDHAGVHRRHHQPRLRAARDHHRRSRSSSCTGTAKASSVNAKSAAIQPVTPMP